MVEKLYEICGDVTQVNPYDCERHSKDFPTFLKDFFLGDETSVYSFSVNMNFFRHFESLMLMKVV